MKTLPLDRAINWYVPQPEFRECHAIDVHAPADVVFETAERFELTSLWTVRGILHLRELLMGTRRATERDERPFVQSAEEMGWGVLELRHGRERVMGAECQPWLADVRFEPVPAESFAVDSRPDRMKIAWSLEALPLGPARSRFVTETRVVANDMAARAKFLRYWRWARFGILAIRWLLLPAIRRDAERRWHERNAGRPTGPISRPVEPRNAHALPR